MTVSASAPEGVLLAQYGELLCQQMEKQGITAQQVLDGTGLQRAQLSEPGRRMSLAATLRMLANVREQDPSPQLGVRMGMSMNIGSHGFLGYAVQSSRTLGQAFELVIRYVRTRTSLLDIRIDRDGARAALILEERYPLGDLKAMIADALITSILTIGKKWFGAFLAHQIEIDMPCDAGEHHRHWREQAGLKVNFGRALLQIHLPAQWLDIPLSTADPQLAALAAARCEEELQQAAEDRDIVTRVRDLAGRHLAEDNSLGIIAAQLHLTTRTLRRRLQQAGTSYLTLVEQIRRRRAEEYLLHTDRSVDDIAGLLGYSDPSNFGRAFRRWYGESPRQFRDHRGLR
ncbi:AraC family transcriptional regulator [uncultured Alcanivorax sp.]|uniref:AraC family transcriptional regulator n=1 Tax=uncultured Alcanivorax sp. TaxID=191215 RepID=UPI00260EB18F|nr:AraC family transcriptional regulator [uncultured Alcanivorax sp.]